MNFSKERWIPIIFALAVSEAVLYRQILESLKFQSLFASPVRALPDPTLLVLLMAWVPVPVFQALVLLVALGAYLGATRSFSLRGFLRGLLAALLALGFGFVGTVVWGMMFSVVLSQLPRSFFYYVIWPLPMFFGLVVGTWAARRSTAHVSAKSVLA